jgi:hypothetical protein
MKLKDICGIEIIGGMPPRRLNRSGNKDVDMRNVCLVPAGAIDNGLLLSDKFNCLDTPARYVNEKTRLNEGDILIKTTAPYSCALIDKDLAAQPVYAASSCMIVRFASEEANAALAFIPSYVAGYLNLPLMQDTIASKTSGSNVSVIKKSMLEELDIPALPLSQQQELGDAYKAMLQSVHAHKDALDALYKLHEAVFAGALRGVVSNDNAQTKAGEAQDAA